MNETMPVRGALSRADEAQLFVEHALGLQSVVSRQVRTSAANVEDACGFAWLQLVRRRPRPPTVFAWLCTTAVREAVKLHRRTCRMVDLHQAAELATDTYHGPEARLELIATGQEIDGAGVGTCEKRLVGPRAAGYNREAMAELTGQSLRTVDRQLGQARSKLRNAR